MVEWVVGWFWWRITILDYSISGSFFLYKPFYSPIFVYFLCVSVSVCSFVNNCSGGELLVADFDLHFIVESKPLDSKFIYVGFLFIVESEQLGL